MTENERVRELRKNYLKLTLEEFGGKIKFGKSSISDIETGRRDLTDQARMLICTTFNVREAWLRDGEGEPFEPPATGPIDGIVRQYDLTDAERLLVEKFVTLPDAERAAILHYVQAVADELTRQENEKAGAEALARQILMDKQAEAGSSASNGAAGSACTA